MTRALAALGLMLVAMMLYAQWERRRAAGEIAKWATIAKRLQRDSAQAATAIHRADTIYTTDTIRLTRTVDKFHTRVDSLRMVDTLTVRERVLVAGADTVIRACRETVTNCEARVAARDSLLRIVASQRHADQARFRAQLAATHPRVTPYVEALTDLTDTHTMVLRGGLELRFIGPLHVITAAQYTTSTTHPFRAVAGVRVTF